MHKLTLLIPGLLAPFKGLPAADTPRFPALESLLAKAWPRSFSPLPFHAQLCGLFGLDKRNGHDLPVAAITRLIDDHKRPEGVWMRADPVHLRAGMNSAVLMDSTAFSLNQREAILLGAELSGLFQERGWEFEVPVARRWYIKPKEPPGILTSEITAVAGRDIMAFLPQGEARGAWDKLQNAVQMVLHDCEVNQERQRRGEPAVNSLWFWGGGELPGILQRRWSTVLSGNPVANGLAMLSGTPCHELPPDCHKLGDMGPKGNGLIILDSLLSPVLYQDFHAWCGLLTGFERDWFAPLLDRLQRRKLEQLVIVTDGRRFTIDRWSLYKLWGFRKPLSGYASARRQSTL